jgi:hypothetical protein
MRAFGSSQPSVSQKGFGRKNELVKHRGCRGAGGVSPTVLTNVIPQVSMEPPFMNLPLAMTILEQLPVPHEDNLQQSHQNYVNSGINHDDDDYQQFMSIPVTFRSQTSPLESTSASLQMPPPHPWQVHFQNTEFENKSVREQLLKGLLLHVSLAVCSYTCGTGGVEYIFEDTIVFLLSYH